MATIEQDLTAVSFHEATLLGISYQGDIIDLDLDDVSIAGARRAVIVAVEGVRGILRDGLPIEHIQMEEGDGEILTLREESGQVMLAVQWNDFIKKSQYIVVYALLGGNIRLAPK